MLPREARLAACAAAVIACASLRAAGARADDDGKVRAEAHRLASEGDDAFAGGSCDRAVPLWRAAEKRFHAPTIVYRIATCDKLAGRVIEASRLLSQIAEERLAPNAPPAFAEVQREAEAELPRVRARIATLEVSVELPPGAPAPRVLVDGAPLPRGPLRIDPGSHILSIGAWEQRVVIADGAREALRFAVTVEEQRAHVPAQRIVGYVLGAIGMATMAGAGVLGAVALTDKHDGLAARATTETEIADGLLAGGGGLFLAGAVIALTSPAAMRPAPRVQVTPMALGAQLVATF